jgi:lipopolysaccharide heptosyltransferase I
MLNGVPRILIIRLSAIGDVVRVLPALHALRTRFPHAQIDWAVEDKSHAVIEGHPDLDQCLVFQRPANKRTAARSFLRFLHFIEEERYDITLDFHGSFKSGLIARASRAPERYGFARPRARELSYLFSRRRVRLPAQPINRVEENLELCGALGATARHFEVPLYVPPAVQEEVDDFFDRRFDGLKRVVAVHPAVERPEKQWPLASYAALTDLLQSDGRFDVLLTWGPGQEHVARQVYDRARRKPVIAPETPGIKHYAWLVQRASLYFGGDTGPMHIAAAMGTPVVAVFGGTDPVRHAPLREGVRVLYAGPANPPRHVPLCEAQTYLDRVTPEEAYDACVELALGGARLVRD